MEQDYLSAVGLKSRMRGLRVTSAWALQKGCLGIASLKAKKDLSRWSSGQSCNEVLSWDQAGMFEETKANLESALSKRKGSSGAKSPEPQPPLKSWISVLGFLQWLRNSHDSISVSLRVTLPRVTLNVGPNLVVPEASSYHTISPVLAKF